MELDIDRLAAALHARQASVFKAVVESCAEDTEITAETAADIGRDAEAAYKEAVRYGAYRVRLDAGSEGEPQRLNWPADCDTRSNHEVGGSDGRLLHVDYFPEIIAPLLRSPVLSIGLVQPRAVLRKLRPPLQR